MHFVRFLWTVKNTKPYGLVGFCTTLDQVVFGIGEAAGIEPIFSMHTCTQKTYNYD
jgi:hypothetical protein